MSMLHDLRTVTDVTSLITQRVFNSKW